VRQRGQELKLASIGATTQRDGEAEVIRRRCSRAIGDEFLQFANERLEAGRWDSELPPPGASRRALAEAEPALPAFADQVGEGGNRRLTKRCYPLITIPVMMLSTDSMVVCFGSMSSATFLPRRSTIMRSTTWNTW
jgi:hypothetical protein